MRESLQRSRTHQCSRLLRMFLIDLLAVKRGHGIMCFVAVAAFGQAPETELIFIEAPEEHRAVVGQHVFVAMFESERG